MISVAFAIALRAAAVNGSGLGGAVAQTSHVSSAGTGSACSLASPCSLATGLAKHTNLALATGVYRLPSTVALTSSDSNHSWMPESGAAPVLVGSVQPGTWTTASGSIQKASVAAGASNRQLWTQASGSAVWNRRIRAQAAGSTLGSWTSNSTGFAGTSTLGSLPDKLDLEIRGTGNWIDMRCPVSAVTNSQITAAVHCWGVANGGNAGGVTFAALGSIENSLSLLTQSGMFYLDGSAGYNGTANELYYQPAPSDGTLSAADVEVPVLAKLVTLNGVSGFTISGIKFQFSSWQPQAGDGVASLQGGYVYQTVASTAPYLWTYTTGASMAAQVIPAAITVTDSPGTIITGNDFENLGGPAVSYQGTSIGSVTGNTFGDVSAMAIEIGSSMMTADQTSGVHNVTVSGNVIRLVGQDYWGNPAIQAGYVSSVTIANNDIDYSSYDGIMMGGFSQPGTFASYGSNTISGNRIYNTMHRTLVDGGPIYLTGNQASGLSSTISGNVATGTAQGPQAYVYLDTRTSFVSVTGNLLYLATGGTCLYYVQVGGSPGFSNVFSGNFSDVSVACNTPDASNTFSAPTHITSIFDSAASAVLAASGNALRGLNVLQGASVSVSSGTTASLLVDGITNVFPAAWTCASTPCTATITRASPTTVREIDVVYNFGNNTLAQESGYQISISADCSSYTQIGAVDTAGSFNSGAGIWYSGIEPFFFTPQTVQCVKVTSPTNLIAFSEIEAH